MADKLFFRHLVIGGTFDYIHVGHRVMLDCAFGISSKVTIGLSSDALVKTMGKATDHNYIQRLENLKQFLNRKYRLMKYEIVELDDRYGPALHPKSDAIVVSEGTEKFADECNIIRAALGYPSLFKVVVPYVLAEDKGPISSTRIRKGEIDAKGRLLSLDRRENR